MNTTPDEYFDLIEAIQQVGLRRESKSDVIEKLRTIQLGWSVERELRWTQKFGQVAK